MFRVGVLAFVAALAAAGTAAEHSDPEAPDAARLAMATPLAAPDFSSLFEYQATVATAPPAPDSDAGAARLAIEHENALWLAAFRSGNVAELAGRYTEDASLVSPGNVTVYGRERIAAWFEAQRAAGLADLSLHTVNVVRVGDLAYETGTWGSDAAAPDGGVASARGSDSGRYYAIWKSRPDGTWGCQVGIWNSNRDALAMH